MSKSGLFGSGLAIVATVVWGCSAGPSSSVALTAPSATTAVRTQLARTFDAATSVPVPNPVVVPCPPPAAPVAPPPDGSMPAPPAYDPYPSYGYSLLRTLANHLHPTDDPAAPCQTNLWTVGVVASSGSQAFSPNPTMAAMGDMLQWTNSDVVPHRLVLDDGTPTGQLIGVINPGDTTPAITLSTGYATYHCTIHPSMVGSLGTPPPAVPGAPAPGVAPAPGADPTPAPVPDPGYYYSYRSHTAAR